VRTCLIENAVEIQMIIIRKSRKKRLQNKTL